MLLPQVLELLYLAAAVKFVQATVRLWSDVEVHAESSRHWANLYEPGTVALVDRQPGTRPSGTSERVYQVWRGDGGQRWRVEYETRGQRYTVAIDRGEYWSGNIADGFAFVRSDIDRRLKWLVNPALLLHLLWLETKEEGMYSGRAVVRVEGRPRDAEGYLRFDFPYAQAYELLVDAEFGTILKFAAWHDSKLFLNDEILEIAFPDTLPEELFRPGP